MSRRAESADQLVENGSENIFEDNNRVLRDYLLEREAVFRKLCDLKNRGWSSTEGDQYFQDRRNRADNPNSNARKSFFRMTIGIGDEMAKDTQVFDLQNPPALVLDLCMAPGGFTNSVTTRFPNATVHAITLPSTRGGHHVIAKSANLSVEFADITMYAAEFGVENVPASHPDATNFSMDRPYSDDIYDLVFCGGAVLRTHDRAEYRERVEGARLTLSQLILAFQRIRSGGTLVLLLHKVEAWDTVRVLDAFSKFADVQLFKPKNAHAIKSSFYLIARNVQPQHSEAIKAVAEWKRHWYKMTFEISQGHISDNVVNGRDEPKNVSQVLGDFGPRLIELGRPVWRTQAKALENSNFLRSR